MVHVIPKATTATHLNPYTAPLLSTQTDSVSWGNSQHLVHMYSQPVPRKNEFTSPPCDSGGKNVFLQLLQMSGSRRWIRDVAECLEYSDFARPSDVLHAALHAWENITDENDIIEAINAHDMIVFKENPAEKAHVGVEHESSNNATHAQRLRMSRLNKEYREKFGFIFLISAYGKSPDQILDEIEERINNDRKIELRRAFYEEGKILAGRIQLGLQSVTFPIRARSKL